MTSGAILLCNDVVVFRLTLKFVSYCFLLIARQQNIVPRNEQQHANKCGEKPRLGLWFKQWLTGQNNKRVSRKPIPCSGPYLSNVLCRLVVRSLEVLVQILPVISRVLHYSIPRFVGWLVSPSAHLSHITSYSVIFSWRSFSQETNVCRKLHCYGTKRWVAMEFSHCIIKASQKTEPHKKRSKLEWLDSKWLKVPQRNNKAGKTGQDGAPGVINS